MNKSQESYILFKKILCPQLFHCEEVDLLCSYLTWDLYVLLCFKTKSNKSFFTVAYHLASFIFRAMFKQEERVSISKTLTGSTASTLGLSLL